MLGLSILLFWLPVLGPLIAGIVGGKKSGGILNGILAAVIPGLLLANLVLLISAALSAVPILGLLLAFGAVPVALASAIPFLPGAIIGGLMADAPTEPLSRRGLFTVLGGTAMLAVGLILQLVSGLQRLEDVAPPTGHTASLPPEAPEQQEQPGTAVAPPASVATSPAATPRAAKPQQPAPRTTPSTSMPASASVIRKAWTSLDAAAQCPPSMAHSDVPGVRALYCSMTPFVSRPALQRLSGIQVFLSGPHTGGAPDLKSYRFGRYNPAFVRWVTENAIPGSTDNAFRLATQPLYDRVLRGIARAYYVAYRDWEQWPQQFEQIKADYERQIRQAGPDPEERHTGGPGLYLQRAIGQFWRDKPPTAMPQITSHSEQLLFMHSHSAALGFWVRRDIDGTKDEFYAGLLKLIRTYDPDLLVTRERAAAPTTGWCTTVDFNGDTLPTGWTASSIRAGPGLRNGRLEAHPVDGIARINYAAAPVSLTSLEVEYDGLTAKSCCGLQRELMLRTRSGVKFTVSDLNTKSSNTLTLRTASCPPTGNCSVLSDAAIPFTHDSHHFRIVLMDGMVQWKVTRAVDGAEIGVVGQNVPSLKLAEIESVQWEVPTTDKANWGDNLVLRCVAR